MELNGLPLDNTKRKRTQSIVLPVYIALSYVMTWTLVKKCLLLPPPKEQNGAGCEASGRRSRWQPLYVRGSAGSVPRVPGREGLRRAHCSHWCHPGRGGAGAGHSPAPCSTKSQRARLATRHFLPCWGFFCFFSLRGWVFFLISRASRWLGERCFRRLHEPAGRSAEFANLSLLWRCQEKEPVHGRGPAPLHPSLAPFSSSLALCPPRHRQSSGRSWLSHSITWTSASEQLRERQDRKLPPVPARHLLPIS